MRAAAYPPDVAARATSLEEELGRPVDRGVLLAECLVALRRRYADLSEAGGGWRMLDAWRGRAGSLWGRAVEWDAGRGIAAGIAEDGALMVRTATGVERLLSGEVRWT